MNRIVRYLVIVGALLAVLAPTAVARIQWQDSAAQPQPFASSQRKVLEEGDSPQVDTVPTVVSYQGRVMVSGVPHNGSGYFKFAIVSAAGTTSFWSNDGTSSGGSEPSSNVSLSVSGGLFNVLLGDTSLSGMTVPLAASVFSNGDRSLRVWFATSSGGPYTHLSPDRRIASAAFALEAEALDGQDSSAFAAANHTHFGQSWTGSSGVGLTLSGGATGVYGSGSSYGLYGLSSDTAVYASASSGAGPDYGVYSQSDDTGVYASGGGYGVYGTGGTGVVGVGAYGVIGQGEDYGVYGSAQSTSLLGFGVYGTASGAGGADIGVYGIATGTGVGIGVEGEGDDFGVYGYSNGTALYGNTTSTLDDWGLYTPDDIRVASVCTGCASGFSARNGSDDVLEAGDLVAVTGVEAPLPDSPQPVIVVRKAVLGDAVVGVVYRAARLETGAVPNVEGQGVFTTAGLRYAEGPAAPGDLLIIVTHGPIYVKASGPMAVGDLLMASAEPGKAQATRPVVIEGIHLRPDGVLGKVLGPPDAATGLVPVLVTLQ